MRMLALTGVWLLGIAALTAEPLDDPTRPPGYALARPGVKAGKKTPSWRLSAIRISAAQRMAIINGVKLEEGEWVNNARVIEIAADHVRLRAKEREFSIRLIKVINKKPVLSQQQR